MNGVLKVAGGVLLSHMVALECTPRYTIPTDELRLQENHSLILFLYVFFAFTFRKLELADPHIKSKMDWLDYLGVIVYRLGFVLAAPSILLLPWDTDYPALKLTFVAATMCASCLHIYMKNFRLLLQATTWGGLLFFVLGFPMFGLGGAFVTLGGLCFKEFFCFKVPGLRLQPLLLAGLWFALVTDLTVAAQVLAAVSALLFFVVSIAKWRMPLHFDIGDKSKYEV